MCRAHAITGSPCSLRGRGSNTQGIGSLVRVISSSGRQQWNRVTTASGYGSSSEPTLFFGLGQDTLADRIEIRWPSGRLQTLTSCPRRPLLECGRTCQLKLLLSLVHSSHLKIGSTELKAGSGRLGVQSDSLFETGRRCIELAHVQPKSS